MKLVYIVNTINGTTGLERMVAVQTNYFIEKYNYNVEIVLLEQKNTSDTNFFYFSDKIKLHDLNLKSKGLNRFYQKTTSLNKLLKGLNPDIVMVCIDDILGLYLPQFLSQKFTMVYQRHSTKTINYNRFSNSFKTKVFNTLKKVVISFGGKGYDKFVVLSEAHCLDWKHLNNLAVIENPIIIDTKGRKAALKVKTVLAVGRHHPVKGFDMLLKCWEEVCKKHPDWKLQIVGKKTTSIDLVKTATDLKIDDKVIFTDYTRDLAEVYLSASILVCSSKIEGFPLVVIEGMSFGLPVVSFDCSYGPRAIINNAEDGLLVPPNDIEALAESICQLIENEDTRLKFGLKASQNILRFSKDEILPKWKILFESLV